MLALTVFERVWDNPDEHLFISERHGVMAAVDAKPRLPLQSVIAPQHGTPGKPAHFNLLPTPTKLKMLEVADTLGRKMLQHCAPQQRAMTHIEGFGVADHAHIVMFAAERGQGADSYNTAINLGPIAVQHTIDVLRFTPVESAALEARLDAIG